MVPKIGTKRYFGVISGQNMDPIPPQHNECETFHWASLAHASDDIVTDF
jgi:hypothetical protein